MRLFKTSSLLDFAVFIPWATAMLYQVYALIKSGGSVKFSYIFAIWTIALLSFSYTLFSKNSLSFVVMSLIWSVVKYSLNFSKMLDDFFSPPSSAEKAQKYEFSKSCGVKSPVNKILEYKSWAFISFCSDKICKVFIPSLNFFSCKSV